MVLELLKNSARATIETSSSPAEVEARPIVVTVSANSGQVAIRIQDFAGGIPFEVAERVWSYTYSTADTKSDVWEHQGTPLAGYGVGLPLSRLYAQYLGGTLNLMSMPGEGTTAFLHMKRLKRDTREQLPFWGESQCRGMEMLLMDYCGLKDGKVRLWWFYSRKDDEKKHSFRELDREALGDEEVPSHVRVVSKVIPIDADGKLARGDEKTSGEKLAEQIFQAAADPSFKPQVDVTSAEVTGGVGQLSQFLWDSNLLGRVEGSQVDIIVAPNVFTAWRKASAENRAVARVKQIDLVSRDGTSQVFNFPPGRKIYICSVRVPREEMRSFLEVCEEPVYTTGDQSLAEAMWMGKVPCVKPDAKVQQWHLALMAKVSGVMDKVPDLGQELRKLVAEESAREAAKRRSKERSEACERQLVAQLGSPPSQWNSTQQVLARSGMLG
ncbi:unnamed protein product [Effrenium voratum]|nr:unnamed protein product [Effrenium voratum]